MKNQLPPTLCSLHRKKPAHAIMPPSAHAAFGGWVLGGWVCHVVRNAFIKCTLSQRPPQVWGPPSSTARCLWERKWGQPKGLESQLTPFVRSFIKATPLNPQPPWGFKPPSPIKPPSHPSAQQEIPGSIRRCFTPTLRWWKSIGSTDWSCFTSTLHLPQT